ncbi:MAG: hypothetical protein M1814_004127 [Vezdaea aestivalis]|nr:MAG: hypothetical protein M1814_004127 [Vezdaea aestivalis]
MQSDQSPSLDRFKQMFNCDNDFEAAANEIHWSLQLIEFYAKSRSPAIDQLQTLLKQLGDSNESKLTKRIETSWQEEHRRRLRHLFNEINQRENNEKRAILRDLSTQLIDLSNDSKPLSAEHDKFQSNICLFVEARTSQEGLRYSEAIQKLREMSFIKNEQSKVLYEAFSKQQAEIALQQRIITCLEYRHILERLPNKKHLLSLRSGKSATATWQTTWNLAIQTELESMIKAYLLRSDSDSEETYELSSSVPPDDQEIRLSPLRLLIQRDFDDWVAQPGSWELEDVNSEQSKSISDESIGSSGKEPKNHVEKTDDLNKGREESKASVEKTDDPKKGPEGSSDSEKPQEHSFPLVQKYQPPYKNWGVYQRGLTLYADLSSNIHNYGRSYKVDRHSWSRSDGLTFDWLKPKINKHGEVDWQEEWIRKGLPQVKKIKKEQPVPQHNILDDDENENENNIYDGTRWLER